MYQIDGKRYPRVTTILGVIAKPSLWEWRIKVGSLEAARISQAAAELGTEIHSACEAVALGGPLDECPARLRAYATAYRDWLAENVRTVQSVEQVVYHERHVYAGQLDAIGVLRDGRRMLLDLKTGRRLDGTYRLQTIAYADALDEMGDPVDGRLIVHLPADRPGEVRAIEYDNDDRDRKAWRACLRLWRWNERHKDDWKQS